MYRFATKIIALTAVRASASPTVYSSAGTFLGRYLPTFDQDVYLGITYAHKPARFTPSAVAPDTPQEIYEVSAYGFDCPSYGSDTTTLITQGYSKQDEDCLHFNIVKPRTNLTNLPVLVWIYGGGWQQGQTSDLRYNLSYIVQQGVLIGKPVIGVSLNYRTAAFGFLYSKEVKESGNTNLGLRDQRVGLQWINRHIADFQGDPNKVTIWGESAGAFSVGDHLNAYNGDNSGLFRAAIMESGNSVGPPLNGTDWYQPMYDRIVNLTGCSNATDSLQCLREVPFEALYNVAYQGLEWFHVVDGDFIPRWGQQSITQGKYAKIPIILGTNTDEGVSFGTSGVNTDADVITQLLASKRWVLTQEQAETIRSHYPNDSAVGSPYGWGNVTWPSLGLEYKRYSSIAGDITMFAPRRLLAESMSKYQSRVYSYRFDSPLYNTSTKIGIQHFSEIPYVFSNPQQNITPLGNDSSDLRLGNLMARMWTAFATDLDPNGHGVEGVTEWPSYGHQSVNFVFRSDTSYVEVDDDRKEGVTYINSLAR